MRRFTHVLGVIALLAGGSAALPSGRAYAAACDGTPAANCDLTGTATLTAGTLTLTAPTALAWSATLNGLDQSVVDSTAAHEQYTVDDATGGGAGWHVTTAATTFTDGTHSLPNIGTFVTNGSVSSVTATTAPTATCSGTCTLPTNSITFPVNLTTAASSPTPSTIYNAAADSGLGTVVIGGSAAANPVGWWVKIPANTSAGTYTSTVTMAIVSGPS